MGSSASEPSYCYLKFANGNLWYQESLSTRGDKFTHYYIENGKELGKEVTKEEFDSLRMEIENGAQPVKIEWKQLEEYGK